MKLKIVTLRDIKIGAYQQPVYVAAVGAAIRGFEDAINNKEKNTDISRHPADFELYLLGEFDDETGKFNLLDQPQFIMGGNNVQE